MTVKEFLKQYGDMQYEVRRIEAEIAELRERALSIRSSGKINDTVQGGGLNNSMKAVDVYIDKELNRLRKAKANALVKRQEVQSVIEAVEDARYRELLSHRYISLRTWEWIAETMHASRRHITRWHGQALQQVTL